MRLAEDCLNRVKVPLIDPPWISVAPATQTTVQLGSVPTEQGTPYISLDLDLCFLIGPEKRTT